MLFPVYLPQSMPLCYLFRWHTKLPIHFALSPLIEQCLVLNHKYFIIYDMCLSFFCDPSSSPTASRHHVNDLPNKRLLVIFHLTFSIIQNTAKTWIVPQPTLSCEIPPILFLSLLSKMKFLVTSWLSMFPPKSLKEASWKETTRA